ncbi:hypothetical protein EJ03DRAFT_241527, partial [Teratosphaeria nubilosa]
MPSTLCSAVAILLLFLTSCANASFGGGFFTYAKNEDTWIHEAESTLIVPAQPPNNKGIVALWIGMDMSDKDFIQSLIMSNVDIHNGEWHTYAFTLYPKGLPAERPHVFIKAGDRVSSHYIYNDATGQYDQTVTVNGQVASTLSTSDGHSLSCYSGLEC